MCALGGAAGRMEERAMTKALWVAVLVLLGIAPAAAQSYTDPVPYCRAVGTIDKPDARYHGPKLPDWMAAALHLEPGQAQMMAWRCADGAVLACLYGANIPCDAKADASRTPTPAVTGYCRDNPNSSFVPMYVTGHETVVSWACQGTAPVVSNVGAVDAQGYAKAYWQPVAP
jgi:hypothetical protein